MIQPRDNRGLDTRNELAPRPLTMPCRALVFPEGLEASGSRLSHRRVVGPAPELNPPGESARVAGVRARSRIRRYATTNRLDALVTITAAILLPPLQFAQRIRHLIRRCTRKLGPVPWLWVAELGSKSGRFHVHMMSRASEADWLAESWTAGAVDVRFLATIEDIRATAHYLAKTFHEPPILAHRYYLSRRFNPQPLVVEAATLFDLLDLVEQRIGWPPTEVRNIERGASFSAFWQEAA